MVWKTLHQVACSSSRVFPKEQLRNENPEQLGATIMMVTHDSYAASYTNRVLCIKDGRLFNEIRRGDMSRDEFFLRIMEVVSFLGGEAGHAA